MANSEISWNSVPGLEAAATRIEAEAGRYDRIISNLYGKVNLVNPETFGDDKGAKEFFAKWEGDVRDWDEGVRGVGGSIRATSGGVFGMARAFKSADDDTGDMADNFGKYINDGLPPVPGGGNGGGGGSNIPPLPPTTGGGGGGNTGGGGGNHGRH